MREILFRAKRIDTGEWVEGFPFLMCWDGCEMWCIGVNPLSANDYSEIIGQNVDWFFIDPETTCQYTGMVDKNGNRIWENDIVSCEHEKYPEDNTLEAYPLFPEPIKYTRNYAVEFINTGSSYGYRLRNKSIHFMLTKNVIQNHKIKTIGNIFDNPELLKGV